MRAWLSALILLGSATTIVEAAPALSPAAQQQVSTGLARGRKLAAQKKYVEAIAAFTDALAAAPNDATVLGELGWTAYLAKDFKTAEAMTRKSLANVADNATRGATYFNLGMIQEANGDRAGAIESYTASIAARPNATVRARLRTLDASRAQAAGPYVPTPLAGPYASIADYCKAAPALDPAPDEYTHCSCGDTVDNTHADALKIAAPFDAVRVFSAQCTNNNAGPKTYDLAVELGGKWYVDTAYQASLHNACGEDMSFEPSATRGNMLLVTLDGSDWCNRGPDSDADARNVVVAIGKGAHGPSAIHIDVSHHATTQVDAQPATILLDLKLALTWRADGFELAGQTTGVDAGAAAAMLGRHVVVFP